jgi:hypothetical protein
MRVSTAAFWTITAIAAGDFTSKATAAPAPPDDLPPSEDLALSSAALSTDVVVTSIAPTESITVESFTSPEVPDAAISEPIATPTFVPVAELMTVNTAPEAIAIPERRIESRMPIEAGFVEAPAPVAPEFIAQVEPIAQVKPIAQVEPIAPVAPTVITPDPSAPDPTDAEVEELQRQLDGVPDIQPEFGDEFNGSPAITISNPSGRGADRFTAFFNTSFQADKRYENGADGSLGVGIGLGDARRAVGLQLSYTLASFGTLGREFGTGGFNAKLHHQFPNGLSAAIGWEGFATIGDVDFEDTVYGSITQIIRTTPDINRPLSRVALTAGVGNGRFRSEEDFNNGVDSVNVFGSAAVRIARPVSVIVEWTGQDLAAGLSIQPIRNFPLVITPALRDIAGAGDGARFVIGTGVSFRF